MNSVDQFLYALDFVESTSRLSASEVMFAIQTRDCPEVPIGMVDVLLIGYLNNAKKMQPEDVVFGICELYDCLPEVPYPLEAPYGFSFWFYMSGEVDNSIEVSLILTCEIGWDIHQLLCNSVHSKRWFEYQKKFLAYLKKEGVCIDF